MIRNDAEVFPLWFEPKLFVMVNKSQGGSSKQCHIEVSQTCRMLGFVRESGLNVSTHFERNKPRASRPPFLHPGEGKVPLSPSPHTLRSTPFSFCYYHYEPTEERVDCARDLSIIFKPRPGHTSFPSRQSVRQCVCCMNAPYCAKLSKKYEASEQNAKTLKCFLTNKSSP